MTFAQEKNRNFLKVPSIIMAYMDMSIGGKKRILLILTLGVTAAIAQGFSIGLLVPVLEFIEQKSELEQTGQSWALINNIYGVFNIPITLPSLLMSVFILVFTAQLLVYLQRLTTAHLREDFCAAVRSRLFNSIVFGDVAFFSITNRGTLINALTEDTERSGVAIFSLIDMIVRIILVTCYIILLLLISWQTSITGILVMAIGSFLAQGQIRLSRKINSEVVKYNDNLHGFSVEKIEGLREVKLSNNEQQEASGFAEIATNLGNALYRYFKSLAMVRFILEPAIVGGGLIIVYLGISVFGISLSQLAVFMYVLVRMAPEVLNLNQHRHLYAGYAQSFENIQSLTNNIHLNTTIKSGSNNFTGLKKSIRFDKVNFAHSNSENVLKDVSIEYKVGTFNVIIGPSGGGKSTLIDIIAKIIEPKSGSVFFDELPLDKYSLESIRNSVGIVSQDILLFNASILDNIRYSKHDASYDEVIEAAKMANAHEFINQLEKKYETILGNRGLTLSGGERQRISLARTLLKKPSILLLDEITSSLDAESERLIQESITKVAEGTTILLVTHRLSMVKKADSVTVIDRGEIAQHGPPDELSKNPGLFSYYRSLQDD